MITYCRVCEDYVKKCALLQINLKRKLLNLIKIRISLELFTRDVIKIIRYIEVYHAS